jgi:hypothetical protein
MKLASLQTEAKAFIPDSYFMDRSSTEARGQEKTKGWRCSFSGARRTT